VQPVFEEGTAAPVVYIMVIFSLLRHGGVAGHGAV